VLDAILVTKVHIEVAKFAQDGADAVLIGHVILRLKALAGPLLIVAIEGRFICWKTKLMSNN
jgi:hypothetical protein